MGNLLFPWARALLWARSQQCTFLSPTWQQLKLGPHLRRERDRRGYTSLFTSGSRDLCGWRRQLALAVCRQVDEQGTQVKPGVPGAGEIRAFRGLTAYFNPLVGKHRLLLDELKSIVRPELIPHNRAPFVAIHVRCGDFFKLSEADVRKFHESGVPRGWRAPLKWSVDAVQDVRSVLGEDVPVRVYSDGSDSELSELLVLPGVERSSGAVAITELLEMAEAKCLIGTPHSTFSMWSAFLGAVPLVGFPEAGNKQYGLEFVTRTLDPAERRAALHRRLSLSAVS